MKILESSANGKKTLLEKEKLLVTSNFSFSDSVFKRLVLQTRKNQGLFGRGIDQVSVLASLHNTQDVFGTSPNNYSQRICTNLLKRADLHQKQFRVTCPCCKDSLFDSL